jgi:hypothetical protein
MHLRAPDIAETNAMHEALLGMQNGTFGPYLTAINGILNSVVQQERYAQGTLHRNATHPKP